MLEIEVLLRQYLLELAHHPFLFCGGVILVLFASSFGLPLPEEVVLITSGIVANLAYAEAVASGQPPTINVWVLSAVCFLAVLMSDLLVFSLGRKYGVSLLRKWPFYHILSPGSLTKVEGWTKRYGAFACCLFRFTPGIRFPGHFMCGALKISYQKFLATDGFAAFLTVPTQVLLLSFYGDEILGTIKQFKIIFFSLVGVGLLIWGFIMLKQKYFSKQSTVNAVSSEEEVA